MGGKQKNIGANNMIRHMGRRGYVKAAKSDDMVKVEVVGVKRSNFTCKTIFKVPQLARSTNAQWIHESELKRLV